MKQTRQSEVVDLLKLKTAHSIAGSSPVNACVYIYLQACCLSRGQQVLHKR